MQPGSLPHLSIVFFITALNWAALEDRIKKIYKLLIYHPTEMPFYHKNAVLL